MIEEFAGYVVSFCYDSDDMFVYTCAHGYVGKLRDKGIDVMTFVFVPYYKFSVFIVYIILMKSLIMFCLSLVRMMVKI